MRLVGTVRGRGKGVLCLLHGLLLDGGCWDFLVERFGETHVMLRPELPGHGTSPVPEADWSLEELAWALARYLDREGVGPVVLVGHSLGAMAVLRTALDEPERVRGLALFSPSAEAAGPGKRMRFAFLRALLPRVGPRPFMIDACARAVFARGFAAREPERFARWCAGLADLPSRALTSAFAALAARSELRPRLAELDVPALVVTGEGDAALHPAEARRLAEGLPRSRFHALPGVGHMLPLEAPGPVGELLADWLERDVEHGASPCRFVGGHERS